MTDHPRPIGNFAKANLEDADSIADEIRLLAHDLIFRDGLTEIERMRKAQSIKDKAQAIQTKLREIPRKASE